MVEASQLLMTAYRLKKPVKQTIVSSVFTLFIATLLIFSTAASAFDVSLGSFSDATPTQGDIITIDASIDIDARDRVTIPYVNLTVNGDEYCVFDAVTGNNLTSCAGISVAVVTAPSSPGYGYGYEYGYHYGYGYGYGYSNTNIEYTITVDTSSFSVGSYDLELHVSLGSQLYSSDPETFTVQALVTPSGGSGTTTSPELNETEEPEFVPPRRPGGFVPPAQNDTAPQDAAAGSQQPEVQPESQIEEPGLGGLITGALPGVSAAIVALLLIAGIVIIGKRRK